MVPTFDDRDLVPLKEGEVVAATPIPDPDGEHMLRPSTGGAPTPHRFAWFAVPADTDADRMREISFEVQTGKPMEQYQRFVIEEAKRARA